jgi:tRNA pseudouridine55 synthase
LAEKAYDATIRLGESTTTDDAAGDVVATADAGVVTDEALRAGIARLTGEIDQVPSSVSAVKVDGRRAYARVRSGEVVELAPRRVTVSRFEVRDQRRVGNLLDVDVSVTCSSGTYVRALARDLGVGLGVGGHLTALRRTRVGPYDLAQARTLDQLGEHFEVVPLAAAAAAAFPVRRLAEPEAAALRHGRPLTAVGLGDGPIAALAPDGSLVALIEESGPVARPLAVLSPA